MTDTAICWFRTDLRLHDNPTLAAAADADELLPVYVFDPYWFGAADYGGPASFTYRKCGTHRARFLRESVADLRASLRERGSDLVVRDGDAATALSTLADAVGADTVHLATHPAPEERAIERRVRDALADDGVAVETHWTHTLHHVDDLPSGVEGVDDTFTPFKQSVENDSRVRETVAEPSPPSLPGPVDVGDLPTITDLLGAADGDERERLDRWPEPDGADRVEAETTDDETADDRAVLLFVGGETRALERLAEYVWERDRLREYKETRNGLLGADYSSKLSPWLAAGCLSPRRVYEEVERYEAERVANDSTYWLVFELRWRDFFAFQTAKHGATLFRPGGIRGRDDLQWRRNEGAEADFRAWARGETGIPFVDANVRELNATGYMSNRGRQNVASFLANDLGVDWRWGAAYFETRLADHDPGSNYGNWAYVAGVGNDSRDRSFDVLWQAHNYDADAEYVAHWVPELASLAAADPDAAHEPWAADEATLADAGVTLGETYPEPMVDPDAVDGWGED
ncbi:DASH family cryptochrome [Halobium salinum]|uniref:Cryptochrome DASH n=1 Tax=Halobium salinum TaxID=1364940 RepID=A0ABD5PC06_9EURY|nr:DASH family cryptochrome [Halobium salinum]